MSGWTDFNTGLTSYNVGKQRQVQKLRDDSRREVEEQLYALRTARGLPSIGPDPATLVMSNKLPRQERKSMGFKESLKFNQDVASKRKRRDDWMFLSRFQADYASGVLSREDAIAVLEARLRG